MKDLADKRAVVTGVTSGIGEKIAEQMLARGVAVAGVARDPAKLQALRDRWGEGFVPITADLAIPERRREVVGALPASFARVDYLVNNAAECAYESPLGIDADAMRRLFEVNVFAAVELTRALLPSMEAGGHVVQLSSVTARHLQNARYAPYAISKTAVERFAEAMRLELHPRGIKVSLVVPGLVATPIYDKVSGFESTQRKMKEQIKEWLAPEDIADAVLWILTRPTRVAVSEIVIMPREQTR